MALYTTLASLSQTPASNAADGTVDAPSTIDNQTNLLASFIAQLRDSRGTYSGYSSLIANTTLTSANTGQFLAIAASSLTITLPAGSTMRVGDAIWFGASVKFTIARGSTDLINGPQATGATSIVMAGFCSVVWRGTDWQVVIGGDRALTANPGFQYFPSGLIMQWGSTVGTTDVGGNLNISFPVAFPTSCFTFVATNGDSSINSGNLNLQTVAASVTTSTAPIHATTGSTGASFASSSVRVNWVAYGN